MPSKLSVPWPSLANQSRETMPGLIYHSGTSSDIALQSSEEEEEEDQDQIFHNSFMTSNHHVGKSDISLAEQLLFPPRDDSENSSEEESDWIVSDGEDEYVDLKAMLAWHGGEDEKILYHPEAKVEGRGGRGGSWEGEGGGGGGGGMFVTDKELEDILSSPLIDVVCRVGEGGGVEAVRRVIAAHSNQYELDATDDKGKEYAHRNISGARRDALTPLVWRGEV